MYYGTYELVLGGKVGIDRGELSILLLLLFNRIGSSEVAWTQNT